VTAVNALLSYFVHLCLLRSTPQQLPASSVLFGLSLVANLLAGVLLVASARADLMMALEEGLADSLMLLAMLWVALRLQGHGGRFLQTATALLGASAVLALVAIPLLPIAAAQDGSRLLGELASILLLVVLVWNMIVFGHIFRHSFNVSLALGIGLAVAYTVFSYQVMRLLYPAA
jgi:hypothetical protein